MSMLLLDEEELERPAEIPEVSAKADWKVALKRAASKFGEDGCTDLAAALTYRSMQSLFPGIIAVLSLLNLFGNGKQTANDVIDKLAAVVGKSPNDPSLSTIRSFIEHITTQSGGGIAFVVGIVLALNSASGYVSAFTRATNKMYGIREGRSTIKLKLSQLRITAIEVILILVVIFAIVATGSVAKELGDSIGLGRTAVTVWDWAKWPFVVFIVVLIIGMLYWAAPNVKKTRRDLFTWGALIGFVVWLLASVALGVYISLSHGASYQKTYGIFANAIIFLLWLWITNLAVLFGAEVDAELLRTRQLRSGLPAEELILLPAKDDEKFAKLEEKAAREYDAAHDLRMEAMREAAGDRHVYGRAELLAGHAAQLVGAASTASRSDKTGLVGARDASAPRPGGDQREVDDMGVQDRAAIEQDRLERRDEFLLKSARARLVRDRLERQRAKAERKRQERERLADKQRRIAESHLTREERWASVDRVRAAYEPPETPERAHIHAEREARRAAYDAQQAQARAGGPQRGAAEPSPERTLPESASRAQVEHEQTQRREEWFRSHRRRTGS